MAKTIHPTERALEAYMALSDEGKRVFLLTVGQLEALAERYAGTTAETAPAPRRGRPAGSKNRAKANPLAPESFEPAALFARNGAVTEDL